MRRTPAATAAMAVWCRRTRSGCSLIGMSNKVSTPATALRIDSVSP
jgi:hypothetical protein